MSERPLSDLAHDITTGAVRLAAATAAWLRLVAEFDHREGWHAVGIQSCAHWLAWQCGMSPGTAREHVRVARALPALPRITTAFAEGRLSYSKVRALTRIAEPDTEESLLEFALAATASQTERMARHWRRADAVDAETIALKQQFDHWWDGDGMLVVRLRMPAEQGARFLTAVDSLAEREARRERAERKRGTPTGAPTAEGPDDRPDEDDEVTLARERTTARRCAAVARLAEAAVDHDRRPGDPPRREVVVHVDLAVLADDAAAGQAHIDGGPPLHPAQARRLLCGATVVAMLEQGREPLALSRGRRFATRAQRRALLRRDGGCARPGCPESRIERLHAHHMRHWLHGGATDISNLVLLCDADHGSVHDLELVMCRRNGRLVVTTPDGLRVWGTADAAFDGGVAGLTGPAVAVADGLLAERFTGVQPIDQRTGRRPDEISSTDDRRAAAGKAAADTSDDTADGQPAPMSAGGTGTVGGGGLTTLLFPGGSPELADDMAANGERADLRWAVAVLMGNRDVTRRLAATSAAGRSVAA